MNDVREDVPVITPSLGGALRRLMMPWLLLAIAGLVAGVADGMAL